MTLAIRPHHHTHATQLNLSIFSPTKSRARRLTCAVVLRWAAGWAWSVLTIVSVLYLLVWDTATRRHYWLHSLAWVRHKLHLRPLPSQLNTLCVYALLYLWLGAQVAIDGRGLVCYIGAVYFLVYRRGLQLAVTQLMEQINTISEWKVVLPATSKAEHGEAVCLSNLHVRCVVH